MRGEREVTDKCRFVAKDQPRAVVDEHFDACEDDGCRGCWPCIRRHCDDCGKTHVDGVCAECIGKTREAIHDIFDLCAQLRADVTSGRRWLDAIAALGSGSTDAKGRAWARERGDDVSHALDESWKDPTPPLVLLVSWEDCWRDYLGHTPDPDKPATIGTAVDYLDQQMTYMATRVDDVPFGDFAREVRRLRAQLEGIVHDERRLQTGTPCLHCRHPLERIEGRVGVLDRWRCPKCKKEYDEQAYSNALAAGYRAAQVEVIDGTTWAITRKAADEVARSVKTIRTWVNDGRVAAACLIAGRRDVVNLDDVKREDDTRKRRRRTSA
jgi:transposase-like protein